MKQGAEGMHAEAGGLASLPALDESDEDSDEDEDEDGGGEGGAASAGGGGGGGGGGKRKGILSKIELGRFQSSTKIEALLEELHNMQGEDRAS